MSKITIWKIIEYSEQSYTDDSGDYEHEHYFMAPCSYSFVTTKSKKDEDNLAEATAEPDIRVRKICVIDENELTEFKKLINTL